MPRGQVTPDTDRIATAFLGRPLTQVELRMIPYIDYVMKNAQAIVPAKVNTEERRFLSFLRKQDHIEGGAAGMAVTREFYDFMQEILWFSYVAVDEQ